MDPSPQILSIPSVDAHPILADVYAPARAGTAVVVLCHGFTGHRRWGFFPYLARRLTDAGLWAVSIDFSLNGTVRPVATAGFGGQSLYSAPERFERNTLGRELDDLRRVVDFVTRGGVPDLGVPERVGLMGHSRGAVAATLTAVEDDTIGALATWSSTDDPDFYSQRQKRIWRKKGRLEFTETSHHARLALGIDYLNDLEQNHDLYRLRDRVRELKTPHLLVHGGLDMVIAPTGSQALYNAESNVAAKKLVVLKSGHTLGMPYPPPDPLDTIPRALEQAADETVQWFVTYLSKDDAE